MGISSSSSSEVHVDTASGILITIIVIMGVLSAAAIGGGIVAIVWNTVSPTQLDFFGVTVSTGHVGVAFTALGLISMFFVIRTVLDHIHKLAALRRDEGEVRDE